MKIKRYIQVILICFTTTSFSQTGKDILNQTLTECEKIRTLKFVMHKHERVKGVMHEDASMFKLNKKPFKMYMKQLLPTPGLEALYAENYNDGEVKVNPNGFPYVNVNLDPYGKKLRQNQHHTIHELGYDYFLDILKYLITKYSINLDNILKYQGVVKYNNIDCYKLFISFPDFKYSTYSVKSGETICSIAKKLKVSEHMILEKNGLDFYTDNITGKTLKVPSVYAKQVTMYISKSQKVPLYISCSDDIGVYEIYEYSKIEINPTFKNDEFSEDYDEYGF